jgi:uracil-DNA glycosylase
MPRRITWVIAAVAALADTVAAWRDFVPDYLPLPHPSPRNRGWMKQNPWFEAEVLPTLRERVGAALSAGDNGGAQDME